MSGPDPMDAIAKALDIVNDCRRKGWDHHKLIRHWMSYGMVQELVCKCATTMSQQQLEPLFNQVAFPHGYITFDGMRFEVVDDAVPWILTIVTRPTVQAYKNPFFP